MDFAGLVHSDRPDRVQLNGEVTARLPPFALAGERAFGDEVGRIAVVVAGEAPVIIA